MCVCVCVFKPDSLNHFKGGVHVRERGVHEVIPIFKFYESCYVIVIYSLLSLNDRDRIRY